MRRAISLARDDRKNKTQKWRAACHEDKNLEERAFAFRSPRKDSRRRRKAIHINSDALNGTRATNGDPRNILLHDISLTLCYNNTKIRIREKKNEYVYTHAQSTYNYPIIRKKLLISHHFYIM